MIGMGSAALTTAVPYPGEATQSFRKGRRITKKNQNQANGLFLVFAFSSWIILQYSFLSVLCCVQFLFDVVPI